MLRVGINRRLGGWGDVHAILTLVDSYKYTFPEHELHFGCPTELMPLAKNYPTIDTLLPSHIMASIKQDYDLYYDVTNPCVKYESSIQPKVDKSRLEIWARHIELPYCKINFKNYTNLLDIEETYKLVPKFWDSKFVVGIITRAHDLSRMYNNWERTRLRLLEQFGNDIRFIVMRGGRRGNEWSDFFWRDESVVVVNQRIKTTLALLNRCKLVVGGDTGPMHSASIFGIPSIWLFGPTDGKIRTKEYMKAEVIQKRSYCSAMPCWYLPCVKAGTGWESYCMEMITPQDIVRAVETHHRRWLCGA